jgi:hypothetical protein
MAETTRCCTGEIQRELFTVSMTPPDGVRAR